MIVVDRCRIGGSVKGKSAPAGPVAPATASIQLPGLSDESSRGRMISSRAPGNLSSMIKVPAGTL
jgi:hypothetical protein